MRFRRLTAHSAGRAEAEQGDEGRDDDQARDDERGCAQQRAAAVAVKIASCVEAGPGRRSSLTEVDEQRNVRTKATFGDAVNAWMRMHAMNENTLADNDALARRCRCRRWATSR